MEVVKSLKSVIEKTNKNIETLQQCKVFFKSIESIIDMYSLNINQFKKDIESKDQLEAIKYAIATLANAEDILINSKACKDTDNLEEYINFLKWFLRSK